MSSYALFGQHPAQIAAPKSLAEVQALVRDHAGTAIVPWGGGCRQRLGFAPERYDLVLSTLGLDQVLEYVPADLTVTVQAGMTLADLQTTLADHGQCLPLDIACPARQTVGGAVATRAGSLRRLAYGSLRDSLLGVTVINSRGEIVKGGGKVVKNVSGYDLPKMYCGSFGTLGLIAEATFKVAPLPECMATVALPLEAEHNSEDVLDSLLGSALTPSFVFLLNPEASGIVLDEAEPVQYVVLGFDGSQEAVAWQMQTLGVEALDEAMALETRARLRDFALNAAPMTAAFHILSSQVGAFSRMVEWTARRHGFQAQVASDAALGLMTAHFAPTQDNADWFVFYADLKDKADRCGGSFVIEAMPEALRTTNAPVWSPLLSDFGLMARLKEALDPSRMWNPGRFIGKL